MVHTGPTPREYFKLPEHGMNYLQNETSTMIDEDLPNDDAKEIGGSQQSLPGIADNARYGHTGQSSMYNGQTQQLRNAKSLSGKNIPILSAIQTIFRPKPSPAERISDAVSVRQSYGPGPTPTVHIKDGK